MFAVDKLVETAKITYITEKIPGRSNLKSAVPNPNIPFKNKGKPSSFIPMWLQVQAAVYLGCTRISCYSYTKPIPYTGKSLITEDEWDVIKFYKTTKRKTTEPDQLETLGPQLRISQLPSSARLCMNLIMVPQAGSCSLISAPKPIKDTELALTTGLVLGNIQLSVFDRNLNLRQGERLCRLWPCKPFDPRMVCAGDY